MGLEKEEDGNTYENKHVVVLVNNYKSDLNAELED